jgi:hypothetical protein
MTSFDESLILLNHNKLLPCNNNNRIYNKIFDRDWFSARLFVR